MTKIMVTSDVQINGCVQQADTQSASSQTPPKRLGHGCDPLAGFHMQAPGSVEPIVGIVMERVRPLVVALAGLARAWSGQGQGAVPHVFRTPANGRERPAMWHGRRR